MKQLLVILLLVVVLAVAGTAVLAATGVISLDGLLQTLGLGQATASRLADYRAPQGEGDLLAGSLPEDLIPDAETRYSFPAELYPYRAMLNADEQSVYAQAYGNALELHEKFPLHAPIPPEALERVMVAVFSDHPALFWLDTGYKYTYTGDGLVVSVTLRYNETAADIERAKGIFDSAARQVVEAARQQGGAAQQEKYVHDYLLDNVDYMLDAKMNQSAYSALVYGESVCAGYARAFQYLMQQLGIPCYFCSGSAGEAHAWNIVQLEGEHYNVDVTWDDPLNNTSGRRYYDYFNLTDAQLAKDHTREGLSVGLPACNGTAYSYANAFAATGAASPSAAASLRTPEATGFSRGEAVASLDAYYAACRDKLAALGQGSHSFTLLVESEDLLQSILRATEDQTAFDHYLPDVTVQLGFDSYSASVSLQGEALSDGYRLLTQQIQYSAWQSEEPAPPNPAPQSEPPAGQPPPDETQLPPAA